MAKDERIGNRRALELLSKFHPRWFKLSHGPHGPSAARRLGLGEALVGEIGLAAAFHDIGKIGVLDELLRRTGPLTADERTRILEHTVIGEGILAPLLRGHPLGLAVARWHHERVDGGGYPDGLRGQEIPLAARIVALADAFNAMISTRPYRTAWPVATALRELVKCAGAQFDAQCVSALLWIVRRPDRKVWPLRSAGRQGRAVCTSGCSPNDAPSLPRPVHPGAAREPRALPQGLPGPRGPGVRVWEVRPTIRQDGVALWTMRSQCPPRLRSRRGPCQAGM